jgi:hypothetical protein
MRPENWPTLLAAYLEERRDLPFAWWSNDCAALACGWFERMYGTDPRATLGISYKDARGAAKALRTTLEDWCAFLEPVRFPGRGDVVLLPGHDGPALGVMTGTHIACQGLEGLVFHPPIVALKAWAI